MWQDIICLPPTPPSVLRRRVGILGIFILVGLLYATVTPIFEISDEVSHYPVIDYIADHAALPVQNRDRLHEWDWEAAQPPLYYVISALIVAPFNRDDLESHLVDNPHGKVGIGLATDNHNFVLHDWDSEAFPYRGTPLHVHLLRLFSLLLGAGTCWMIFTVARLAVPHNPTVALVALCLTAFNPMFIAISASVNNDTLVNFLLPLGFAVILTLWRSGFTWQGVWVLALICTLASAAKLSGMILFVPSGLVILLVVLRDKLPIRNVIFAALIFAAVFGVLFGWWYVRNWQLYDDPLGNTHMAQTVGVRPFPLTLWDLFKDERFSFYAAYWGWFGALNVLAPMRLFYFTYGLVGLSVLGLLLLFRRGGFVTHPSIVKNSAGGSQTRPSIASTSRQTSEELVISPSPVYGGRGWGIGVVPLLLSLTLLLGIYSLISWTLKTPASQGRLLFPFMMASHTLLAVGLVRLLKNRLAVWVTMPLLVYAVYCGVILIPQAYRLPAKVEELPADAQQVDVIYDQIELLGYKIDDTPIRFVTPLSQILDTYPRKHADGRLAVTLYWRPLERTAQPLSFYVQVFEPGWLYKPEEIGKLDSYPGGGLLQTDTWQTGVIYEDRYRLEVDHEWEWNPSSFEPRLKVGWRDQTTETEIPATNHSGDPIDAVILRGGRVIQDTELYDSEPIATFGNLIQMYFGSAEQCADHINVYTTWEALLPISEDFTVFVQLVDPQNPGQPLAFGDSTPRGGWWRTSLWVKDNPFSDLYVVPVPADLKSGDYKILLGFYRPADFTRLPVNVPPYPDAIELDVTIHGSLPECDNGGLF